VRCRTHSFLAILQAPQNGGEEMDVSEKKSERSYSYLTLSDRQTLAARFEAGDSVTSIATDLGVHAATLYRELKRGKAAGKMYDPELANKKAREAFKRRG
jgi:IS30 family transposase